MTAVVIEGAAAILPGRVERFSVRIEAGRNAFERQLMPRPGVAIPVGPALMETDRQLAANGIATAFHALTLSWEPGLRSVEMGRSVAGALNALAQDGHPVVRRTFVAGREAYAAVASG